MTATWPADSNYTADTATQSTTAIKATTTTALGSRPNPSTEGQAVTFTAIVVGQNGGTPTGTVTFQNVQDTKMRTERLASATASLSISTLAVGTVRAEAVYSGDANFAASTSNVVTQVVNNR
jgi:hypothetical protein